MFGIVKGKLLLVKVSLFQIGMLEVNFQLSSKILQFCRIGSHSVARNK